MTNDVDTLATALYAATDDMLKEHPDLAPWRPPVEARTPGPLQARACGVSAEFAEGARSAGPPGCARACLGENPQRKTAVSQIPPGWPGA